MTKWRSQMKALLIGGTGTISMDITKLCVERGYDVTLLNRGNRNSRLPESMRVSQWALDINDENAVRARLEGEYFDVIVNFINYTTDQVERDIRLFADKTNQYIFISSASAYQKPLSHYMVTESTPLSNPFWDYSRDKIACEERLMAEYRNNGFPITIVRPSHTYDKYRIPVCIHGGNGSWSTISRMLEGKPVLVIGDGTSLWTLTHSQDFAKGFIGLMGNIKAIGESVHITSDEALTWNQIYTNIARAFGVRPNLFHVATDFITAVDPSYNGQLHGDKGANVLFDNSKIKRLVPGFTATIRFDQGAKMAAEYYLNDPESQIPDPNFDIFVDTIIEAQMSAIAKVKAQLQR